jgi:hypothetical protein
MTAVARSEAAAALRGRGHLIRIRWAVRAALTLGVAASVAANTLHANTGPISKTIAAWPPVALLLTIELISRVPIYRPWLAAARLAATITIAAIAAWISYWHMAAVVTRYGENGTTPYLLPLSVDGLILVASVSLIELTGRISTTADTQSTVSSERIRRPAPGARIAEPDRIGTSLTPSDSATRTLTGAYVNPVDRQAATTGNTTAANVSRGRSAADVAAAVALLRQQQPPPHPAQIAAEVGRSVRQVLRIIKRLDEQPRSATW